MLDLVEGYYLVEGHNPVEMDNTAVAACIAVPCTAADCKHIAYLDKVGVDMAQYMDYTAAMAFEPVGCIAAVAQTVVVDHYWYSVKIAAVERLEVLDHWFEVPVE